MCVANFPAVIHATAATQITAILMIECLYKMAAETVIVIMLC